MKSFKCVCLGFAAGVLVMGTVPAIAKSGAEMIRVTYRNIKVCVDGEEINTDGSEPFVYDGTTYLPIRKISEAFGKEVRWDGSTNTVYLGAEKEEEILFIFDVAKPSAKERCIIYQGDALFEYAGGNRRNGFKFENWKQGYITFDLDGNYSSISFKYFGDAQIYVDDTLVQELSSGDSVQSASLSLNGSRQITIKGNGYAGFWDVMLH